VEETKSKFSHDSDLEGGAWKRTFFWDLCRALPMGVTETVGSTFGLLIAIRYLDVSTLSKSYFMAGSALGMLVSVFSVAAVRRLGISANLSAATAWLLACIGFAIAALSGVVCS